MSAPVHPKMNSSRDALRHFQQHLDAPSVSRFLSSPCVCLLRSFFGMGEKELWDAPSIDFAALVFVMFNDFCATVFCAS